MTESSAPDITEMTAVHRIFRNAFASAPQLVGSVAEGDDERAELVGGYYGDVLEFLRVHHEGEDLLMFPRLVERSSNPDVVARIGAQHHDVETALEAANEAVAAFRASGSRAAGLRLIEQLDVLRGVLEPHLDEEERMILPIVEEHLTLEEWGAMPGHAMQSFQGDDMFLIIGLVREQFTDDQNARMLAGMPPPVVDAWQSVGLQAYAAKVAALVRGL
jgi:hypothetical protein